VIDNPVKLSLACRETISDVANEVYLSAVSAWEICVKHRLGGLTLSEAADTYIPRQRERHRIETLPLDEVSVLQLSRLPAHHKDPFDRMLICQAIAHGLAIVTPDPLITRYPVRTLW
jgi:PIN domain nuclease of toxin-antitoxin system